MQRKCISLIIATLLFFCVSPISLAKKASAENAQQMPPTVVEAFKVQYVKRNQQITTTGSMRATKGIMVRPEISGRITQIYFHSGDEVAAGAKLIQINPDILNGQLKQAQAELTYTKQNYWRMAHLYRTHTISKSDLDQAVSDLNSNQGKVEEIQAELRQTSIVAAFAGRIGVNVVDVGDFVSAGQDLVYLQAINPIDVEFGVPEVYLNDLKVGNQVTVRSDAYGSENFTGKVYAIDSKVDPDNRNLTVRARIPNAQEKLLPGMFVEVTLVLVAGQKVLEVPQTALVYEIGQTYVYKIVDNKAKEVKVNIGARDVNNVVILSGIKAGDTIITAGQLKLHDGASVEVENTQSKTASTTATKS